MDLNLLWIYLLAINIITFIVFALDKKKAKSGAWRIKERTLLALALIGGSLGAMLSMLIKRHKTQKIKFTLSVPLMLIAHLLIIFYLVNI